MQTDDHAVEEILSEGRRFMVPLYQRKYQWHDSQLLPFWEDVEAKAKEILEGNSKFQHYLRSFDFGSDWRGGADRGNAKVSSCGRPAAADHFPTFPCRDTRDFLEARMR